MKKLNPEFSNVILETQTLLHSNPEWQTRYKKYAEEILANTALFDDVRKTFREWSPLYLYINITNAKKASGSFNFELRFLGQTVAELKAGKGMTLNTAKFDKNNERDFACKIALKGAEWRSPKASEFRKHFKNFSGKRSAHENKSNEEHRIESVFLREFSMIKSKKLRNIKPVKISRVRFPMPTPISASNHKQIKCSGVKGGGIDILARIGTGGVNTNLCIMELKDENTTKEPPKDAIKQALAYATFIRELLRSECGEDWWKIFGFGNKVPEKLVLFACCVMPSNTNDDTTFGDLELDLDGDIIKLHYLYFTEEENRITNHITSLKLGNTP